MKKNSALLFTLNKKGHGSSNPILLRIQLDETGTKIDFGYAAIPLFITGGWIRIQQSTYLQIKETGLKLTLTKAVGITINPEHHYFKSTKDWQFFSLYFPPIPATNCTLDVIEIENGAKSDFNYYGIALHLKDAVPCLI